MKISLYSHFEEENVLSVDMANVVNFSMCRLAVAPDASNLFVAKNSLSNRRHCKATFVDNSEEDVRRGQAVKLKKIVPSLNDTKHTTFSCSIMRVHMVQSLFAPLLVEHKAHPHWRELVKQDLRVSLSSHLTSHCNQTSCMPPGVQ